MIKSLVLMLVTIFFIVVLGRALKKYVSLEKQIAIAVGVTLISVFALITQDISILNIHSRLTYLNDSTAPLYMITYIGGIVFLIDLVGEYFKKKKLKKYYELYKKYGNVIMVALIILGAVADIIFRF